MSRQLVIVENEGRPDIVNDAKNIVICTNNTNDGKFKRYVIYIDENGVAQLECLGNYEQDEEEDNEYREEFSKQHKDVTFYVVNYKLKQFIESKGLFPIIDDKSEDDGTCHNLRTENCFWRYIKNQELDIVINEWKSLYY